MSSITLCILLYSDWKLVEQLFQSLAKQERHIKKIIISSDNPEDIDLNVIRRMFLSYEIECDYLIRENSKNLGPIEHVKILLSLVDTEFVMFSGADDYFHSNYFYVLSKFLGLEFSAITPLHYRVNKNNRIIGKSNYYGKTIIDDRNLSGIIKNEKFPLPSPGTVYRVSVLKKVKYSNGIINEDDQFLMACVINGGWKIIPMHLFYYRVSDSGLSSWHRKPFISKRILKNILLSESLNRREQNLNWINLLKSSNLSEASALIELCSSNAARYQMKISDIERGKEQIYVIHHRYNALLKRIKLLTTSFIHNFFQKH